MQQVGADEMIGRGSFRIAGTPDDAASQDTVNSDSAQPSHAYSSQRTIHSPAGTLHGNDGHVSVLPRSLARAFEENADASEVYSQERQRGSFESASPVTHAAGRSQVPDKHEIVVALS
jgi:hypothetical protein